MPFRHRVASRPRDAFARSTKVGRLLTPIRDSARERPGFVDGLPFEIAFDYSADGARRSIEASLDRLGLDHIDITYIHDIGEDTHRPAWRDRFDEAMTGAAPALRRMRDEGVIRAWGLGVNLVEPCLRTLVPAGRAIHAAGHGGTRYAVPAMCGTRGVGGRGRPYNSGLLAGGGTYNYAPAPPRCSRAGTGWQRRAGGMTSICGPPHCNFRAAHLVVAAVIPGTRTAEEVRQNAALMTAAIPPALWAELRDFGPIPAQAPVPDA